MRKVRKIQAKRKVCTKTKTGKKKCFIIKVPKIYRINPDNEFNFEIDSAKYQTSYLLDVADSTRKYAKDLDSIGDFLTGRDKQMIIEIARDLSEMGGRLLQILMKNESLFPSNKKFGV